MPEANEPNPFETPQSVAGPPTEPFTGLWVVMGVASLVCVLGVLAGVPFGVVASALLVLLPGSFRAYLVLSRERQQRQETPGHDRQIYILLTSIGGMLSICFFTGVTFFASALLLRMMLIVLQTDARVLDLVSTVLSILLSSLVFLLAFYRFVKPPIMNQNRLE